jgi:hypothetical protein
MYQASTSKTTLEARRPPQKTITKRTASKQSSISEENEAGTTSSSMKRNNSARQENAHVERSGNDDSMLPPSKRTRVERSNEEYEDLETRQRDLQVRRSSLPFMREHAVKVTRLIPLESQSELKYVRKAHKELLDLRETAAEAALKDAVLLGTSRLEGKTHLWLADKPCKQRKLILWQLHLYGFTAQKKQTATYVKENEELKGQIESLREEVAQLSERLEKISRDQEAAANPTAGDVTADTTMDASIADGSTSATGSKARRNDPELTRRAEEAQTRNLELQEENETLKQQLEQIRREAKKNRKEWEADKASIRQAASDAFQSEKRRSLAEKEENDARSKLIANSSRLLCGTCGCSWPYIFQPLN